MDPKTCEDFLSGLLGRKEIYASYFLPEGRKSNRDNLASKSISVTAFRQALHLEGLSDAEWVTFTSVNPWLGAEWPGMSICNFDQKLANVKPIEVTVAARSWDEDQDILAIVLQEAEKAGMTPCFAEDSE